ncbi:STAS domain-containing protein [Umezawaea sp.]|uniref:STAS domain-containing protein n=1 Tax=Umezawaea sp. TaxID=1955258 RepID=UPI002ECFB9A0
MTFAESNTNSDTGPSPARADRATPTANSTPLNAVPTPRSSLGPPPPVVVGRGGSPALAVTALADNQAIVLVVEGEIDLNTAPILRRALESAAVPSPALMVVDLSAVNFLACAGLAELVAAHRRAGGRTRLRVVASGRAVLRVLELGGLDKRLNVCRTRSQALAPTRNDL